MQREGRLKKGKRRTRGKNDDSGRKGISWKEIGLSEYGKAKNRFAQLLSNYIIHVYKLSS